MAVTARLKRELAYLVQQVSNDSCVASLNGHNASSNRSICLTLQQHKSESADQLCFTKHSAATGTLCSIPAGLQLLHGML